jgi:FkbM family methyltransferase
MFSRLKATLLMKVSPAWRSRIVEAKNMLWGGWRHHYYAHFGEDAYISSYFRHQKTGFYVDVGAHHPKRYSNTALLHEKGWRGINIDPDAYTISLFKRARPSDINLQVGVGAKEETLDFHRYSDGAVNTFSNERTEKLEEKKWLTEIAVEKVRVYPLHIILEKHLPAGAEIDFLNIDIEGLDVEALESNDWQKFRPRMIAIEDLGYDPLHPSESKIFQFLVGKEYIFIGQIGLTLIFLRKDEVTKKQKNTKK